MNKPLLNINKIHDLHRQGHLEEAKLGYLNLLESQPQNVQALHALGIIYVEQDKLGLAETYLKLALELESDNPSIQLHLANVFKMQGLFKEAITLLNNTVTQHPEYAPGFNNLGILYYLQGEYAQAITWYQSALEKQPHYIDAYYNLGLALTKNNELETAAKTYQQLLAFNPTHSAARYHLACIYMQQENWETAIEVLLELSEIHPQHLETQMNLATCYLKRGWLNQAKKYYLNVLNLNSEEAQALFNLGYINTQLGNIEQAIPYYQQLLAINPNDFSVHYNLGVIYFAKKQKILACQHLEQALDLEPKNISIQHMLNIIKHDKNIINSPPEYLKTLFDYYAEHYEFHLINTLEYQVPQILYQAILHIHQLSDHKIDILDIGCGTGLCGDIFKLHAARLIGIDLSPKMLKIAAEKNIYTQLICQDFFHYLNQHEKIYDLIIAGDALVYLGDLSVVFKYIKKTLRSHGLFTFNAEVSQQDDYLIHSAGRFCHSQGYIEKLAKNNGLDIIFYQLAMTRLQNHEPVYGHIYVLQNVDNG